MNNKNYQNFVIATASLAFGLVLINANPAQAAKITYDFSVSIDSGTLLNETYSGSFSFDDITLTGVGDEFLPVSDLKFNFLDTDYIATDDSEVVFLDGNFLGLSFSTDAYFSFVPGFFSLNESFFAYDLGSQEVGIGDINYTVRSSNPVPEPATIIGFVTTVILGSSLRKNKFCR